MMVSRTGFMNFNSLCMTVWNNCLWHDSTRKHVNVPHRFAYISLINAKLYPRRKQKKSRHSSDKTKTYAVQLILILTFTVKQDDKNLRQTQGGDAWFSDVCFVIGADNK